MFGKNAILKVARTTTGALDVHSVFYTIQGEGPFAGRAAVFVRLHGCSLACSWCDTEFESACVSMSPERLLEAVRSTVGRNVPNPLIVISGGEPMRQPLAPFARVAICAGYQVQVETAGIHWQEELVPLFSGGGLSFVCSPKTPVVHRNLALYAAAFKYIISAQEEASAVDGLPYAAVSQRGQPAAGMLFRPPNIEQWRDRIFVQPMDVPSFMSEDAAAANRANRDRCVYLVKEFGYRLSLQQHKILGVE